MGSTTIKMRDGSSLYYEISKSSSPHWIIWVHGICEHLGRYPHMEELFLKDFNILKFDLRGHGRSEGKRAYVDRFEDFVEDLHEVIQFIKKQFSNPKYVLMGHSMGALIIAGYMQNKVDVNYYPQGVFFNSPPAGLPGANGVIANFIPQGVTNFLSNMNIGLDLKGLVALDGLSHDSRVGKEYLRDKLNSLIIHSRLMFNLVNYGKKVFSKPLGISCPAYTAVGSKDSVVCPQTIIHYCEKIDPHLKMKVFDGAYHELHNEIDEYRLPYFEYMKDCVRKFIK